MTKEEIIAILQQSNRWGVNYQPELEVIVDVLLQLPLKKLTVKRSDVIELVTSRPLTAREAYMLARLNPDHPDEIKDDQVYFQLWWD